MFESAGEYQDRLKRPRPAVCMSARTTVKGELDFLARSNAKVFVEVNSSKIKRVSPLSFKGNKAAIFSEDNTMFRENCPARDHFW